MRSLFLFIVVALSQAGCASFDDWNYDCVNSCRSRMAWYSADYDRHAIPCFHDFGAGWRQGFYDVSHGRRGRGAGGSPQGILVGQLSNAGRRRRDQCLVSGIPRRRRRRRPRRLWRLCAAPRFGRRNNPARGHRPRGLDRAGRSASRVGPRNDSTPAAGWRATGGRPRRGQARRGAGDSPRSRLAFRKRRSWIESRDRHELLCQRAISQTTKLPGAGARHRRRVDREFAARDGRRPRHARSLTAC